jgi:hypothetical protein
LIILPGNCSAVGCNICAPFPPGKIKEVFIQYERNFTELQLRPLRFCLYNSIAYYIIILWTNSFCVSLQTTLHLSSMLCFELLCYIFANASRYLSFVVKPTLPHQLYYCCQQFAGECV